jgi:hypothetical protein
MNVEKAVNHNEHDERNEKTMTYIVLMNRPVGSPRRSAKARIFVVPVASLWSELRFPA